MVCGLVLAPRIVVQGPLTLAETCKVPLPVQLIWNPPVTALMDRVDRITAPAASAARRKPWFTLLPPGWMPLTALTLEASRAALLAWEPPMRREVVDPTGGSVHSQRLPA